MRVVTANLFFGRARPGSVQDAVRSVDPDVLAVQELTPTVADAISEVMSHGRHKMRWRGASLGLFFSRPAEVEILQLPSHEALRARLDPTEWPELEAALEVMNVHLSAPHHQPPWRPYRERAADVAALEAHLGQSASVGKVLLGDLNSTPKWPAYRRLTRLLDDAAELAGSRNGAVPDKTWGPWPGAPRLFRIDHVLVSGVEVTSAGTVEIKGSDHDAVVVDFKG